MSQGVSELLKCVYRYRTNVDLWHTCPDEDTMEFTASDCKPEI